MTRPFLFSLLFASVCIPGVALAQRGPTQVPTRVPPRRSHQLADGFGMNVDLPRDPRLPWTRRWWTRIYDSGVKWVRIGQYENSSEKTCWDWVEQTPGHFAVSADVDEAIRSLAENGVRIEIELQYSNPLYQGDPAARPERVILPPPGIGPGDEPPNPIFIPPTTDEQIEAFLKYVRFMVGCYKGVVKHWELWNEPNINYWRLARPGHPYKTDKEQLMAKAQEYGRLLSRFADAVHETDPQAKVISAGISRPDLLFLGTALAECAAKVDIVAYHTYPGFGSNHTPEEADTVENAAVFRERIRHIPGIRNDVEFWLNEWNVSPRWKDSNESVQARYLPRFYLYNLAQQVKGFIWVLVPSTDGNEDDLFGILHGETFGPDAFEPRQAYQSFVVTSALFGQAAPDPMAEFRLEDVPTQYQHGQVQSYAFRDMTSGKPIYAFWLAVNSDPADHFPPVQANLVFRGSDIENPVLIDVRTGEVSPLAWKAKGVLAVPLKDTVMAVSDASYLDWPELPETPGQLRATRSGAGVGLEWKIYGEPEAAGKDEGEHRLSKGRLATRAGDTRYRAEVQRSIDYGPWQAVGEVEPGKNTFSDTQVPPGHITYRVRVAGKKGSSAWSNPAWVDVER